MFSWLVWKHRFSGKGYAIKIATKNGTLRAKKDWIFKTFDLESKNLGSLPETHVLVFSETNENVL